HKTVEYAEIGHFYDSVDYQLMLADFSGQFHDLRHASGFKQCLDPKSYVASQALAELLLENGSLGVVYPSVRQADGVNLACFRPALVNNVRRDAAYRLTWSGSPEPAVKIQPKSKSKNKSRRPARGGVITQKERSS
ncbi:MAG TPA: RES family NAD+ phosphorylase, partial [Pusillimonas sp.]